MNIKACLLVCGFLISTSARASEPKNSDFEKAFGAAPKQSSQSKQPSQSTKRPADSQDFDKTAADAKAIADRACLVGGENVSPYCAQVNSKTPLKADAPIATIIERAAKLNKQNCKQ